MGQKVIKVALTGYIRIMNKVEKGKSNRNRKGTEKLGNMRFKIGWPREMVQGGGKKARCLGGSETLNND